MIRLGFAVRVLSRPGLRSHATNSAAAPVHLSVGLVHLRDVLVYLDRIGVHFYRIAPVLLSSAPEAALLQIAECSAELAFLAAQLERQDLRLGLHLDHGVALGVADAAMAARSLAQIEAQAALLERLDAARAADAPRRGVIVVHVGGSPSDRATLERFAARYQALSPQARARLVVEHDSAGFSLGALLALHQYCRVPVVFDRLHWQMHNPERLPLDLALGLALATWPPNLRPEVHLSTARSEAHLLVAGPGKEPRVLPPRPGQHADFVATPDLVDLLRAARGLPAFDLMLEAKAGDLALLRLRAELKRHAPQLAACVG